MDIFKVVTTLDGAVLLRPGSRWQGIVYPDAELAAEDVRSIGESSQYFVRWDEASRPPVPCECCGWGVVLVPEALTELAGGGPAETRRWKPGIWEDGTGRRHTPRRCDWRRWRALSPPADGA